MRPLVAPCPKALRKGVSLRARPSFRRIWIPTNKSRDATLQGRLFRAHCRSREIAIVVLRVQFRRLAPGRKAAQLTVAEGLARAYRVVPGTLLAATRRKETRE